MIDSSLRKQDVLESSKDYDWFKFEKAGPSRIF